MDMNVAELKKKLEKYPPNFKLAGVPAILYYVESNNTECVKILLEHNVDLEPYNDTTGKYESALNIAIDSCNFGMIKLLCPRSVFLDEGKNQIDNLFDKIISDFPQPKHCPRYYEDFNDDFMEKHNLKRWIEILKYFLIHNNKEIKERFDLLAYDGVNYSHRETLDFMFDKCLE
jgi:hypothetical protein